MVGDVKPTHYEEARPTKPEGYLRRGTKKATYQTISSLHRRAASIQECSPRHKVINMDHLKISFKYDYSILADCFIIASNGIVRPYVSILPSFKLTLRVSP